MDLQNTLSLYLKERRKKRRILHSNLHSHVYVTVIWNLYCKIKKDKIEVYKEFLVILEIFISFYKVMMCWVVGSHPTNPSRPSNPLARAAPPLGLPPAPREILIHRSRGCSSNPPADAPSLLPRQPAPCPPTPWAPSNPTTTTRVWMSVHSSVHLSVRASSVCSKHTHIFRREEKKKGKKIGHRRSLKKRCNFF